MVSKPKIIPIHCIIGMVGATPLILVMAQTYPHASVNDGARKMIQPIVTSTKVRSICGSCFHTNGASLNRFDLPNKISGKKSSTLYNPHTKYVQFAPCHKPQIRNTIITFRTTINFLRNSMLLRYAANTFFDFFVDSSIESFFSEESCRYNLLVSGTGVWL